MKRILRHQAVAVVVLAALLAGSVNCGLILHPERKGTKGGKIDGPILVMDCLWLLAGVVPGVVAIVVDFATGCVYESGMAVNARPDDSLTFRLRGPAPENARVSVTLASRDGGRNEELLTRSVTIGEEAGEMRFNVPADLTPGAYLLDLNVDGQVKASWDLRVQ